MSDRNKSSIETKWDCEGFDECKDEAKLRIGKFNSFLTILGIAVGIYEFVMILFSYGYSHGLQRKQWEIRALGRSKSHSTGNGKNQRGGAGSSTKKRRKTKKNKKHKNENNQSTAFSDDGKVLTELSDANVFRNIHWLKE